MTNRLENLKTVRTMLDGLQSLTDAYKVVGADREDVKRRVAKATDEMLVFLRTNFSADEALAVEIAGKRSVGNAFIPSSKAFKSSTVNPPTTGTALTEDQQALKDGVRDLYRGNEIGQLPLFEPENLVETRDGVITVLAMRYLLSTIRAPVATAYCEHFEDFSQTYKGVILVS